MKAELFFACTNMTPHVSIIHQNRDALLESVLNGTLKPELPKDAPAEVQELVAVALGGHGARAAVGYVRVAPLFSSKRRIGH